MSLGIKMKCWYLRSDSEPGRIKQQSDIYDIGFISMTMRKQGETVQAEVSKQVAIGRYHMLMVVLELLDDRNLEDFEAAGVGPLR
jgi:hypothetical protein